MIGKRITVDGAEYPVVERLPTTTKDRPTVVRMPDGSERVAVWRLVRWEWWQVKDRMVKRDGG
jgi:hypothetical protein